MHAWHKILMGTIVAILAKQMSFFISHLAINFGLYSHNFSTIVFAGDIAEVKI